MSTRRQTVAGAIQLRQGLLRPGADTVAVGTAAGAMTLGLAESDPARAREVLETLGSLRPADAATAEAGDAGRDQHRESGPDRLPAGGDGGPPVATEAHAPTMFGHGEWAARLPHGPTPAQHASLAPEGGSHRDGERDWLDTDEPGPAAVPGGVTTVPIGAAPAVAPAVAGGVVGSEPSATPTLVLPALALLDTAEIAQRIADQITTAIEQISTGIADGVSSEALVQTIASGIAETVATITRDIEQATGSLDDFVGDAADVIGTTSLPGDLAGDVLDNVDGLLDPADADGPARSGSDGDTGNSLLAAVPATLLGAHSAESTGGLLAEVFYSDGEAPAPALPAPTPSAAAEAPTGGTADLAALADAAAVSAAATVTEADSVAAPAIDFAGLSYLDTQDLPYSGMHAGLGGLHLA